MMKRLLLGLMLLVTATAASAEWTIAGETRGGTDDYIQYVDRATIRRNGDLVKMWGLTDFKTVQKAAGGESYLSGKTQWEFDCKDEKVRSLAFTWFGGQMGSGKVVYADGDVRGKWQPIEPGSVGETQWKIACGRE